MGGQSQRHVDCVPYPTKEHLKYSTLAVTFVQFLEQDYFLPLGWVHLAQRSQDLVQSMENGAAHLAEPVG